jgi:hypothetical protein
MGRVLVFKTRMVDRNPSDLGKQDNVALSCQRKSLHAFLEAENFRLRQAVVELLLDTKALRAALKLRQPQSRHRRFCSLC